MYWNRTRRLYLWVVFCLLCVAGCAEREPVDEAMFPGRYEPVHIAGSGSLLILEDGTYVQPYVGPHGTMLLQTNRWKIKRDGKVSRAVFDAFKSFPEWVPVYLSVPVYRRGDLIYITINSDMGQHYERRIKQGAGASP